MIKYQNLSGRSGVFGFELGAGFIKVEFSDGAVYLYTTRSVGNANLDKMQTLALAGTGLNSFITTTVRINYEQKLVSRRRRSA